MVRAVQGRTLRITVVPTDSEGVPYRSPLVNPGFAAALSRLAMRQGAVQYEAEATLAYQPGTKQWEATFDVDIPADAPLGRYAADVAVAMDAPVVRTQTAKFQVEVEAPIAA